MDEKQAKALLNKLAGCYPNYPINKEGSAVYLNVVINMDFHTADQAINDIISKSKYFPTVAELKESYISVRKDEKHSQQLESNSTILCHICNDKGYIIYRDKEHRGYVAYCSKCEAGQSQKYDGKRCKEHKSNYYIPAANEIFDIEELRHHNQGTDTVVIHNISELREQLQKVVKG
jgi:hypothetical protein